MLPPFLDVKRCNVVLELVLFDLTECFITQLLVLFQSLDSEERVFVRDRSGYTPPRKQPRSTVGAMMEAGLDDPEDVTSSA